MAVGEEKTLSKWLTPANLPMVVIGLLIVGGTIVTIFAGLPFPTKQELAGRYQLYDERIESQRKNNQDNTEAIRSLTTSLATVTTAITQLQQIQIDRDKAEAHDQEYQLKRQEYFYKRQDQHHRHEVDALTGLLKERPQ